MKYWPVPDSYSKSVPACGSPGSFWEDRNDRRHSGVDIYAPKGSSVLSIEDGIVIDTGVFTSPDKVSYWNITYYILIENKKDFVCKYAELGAVKVKVGESVKAGQLIGYVGLVLNSDKITDNSPVYLQKLKEKGNCSMLHFELYKFLPIKTNTNDYLGGSLFNDAKPKNLLNPRNYLKSKS